MEILRVISNNTLRQNTYLITTKNTAILIDCGAPLSSIAKEYQYHHEGRKLPNIDAIFLTHTHFDHELYLGELDRAYKPDIFVRAGCKDYVHDPMYNVSNLYDLNLTFKPTNVVELTAELPIKIKDLIITPIFTPGHSKCSITYVIGDCVFTGDTLFSGGIGRTDFIGGDDNELNYSIQKIKSIKHSLYYPGHGIPFK